MPTSGKRSHRRRRDSETRFDILDFLIDPRRHDIPDFEVRRSFHQDGERAVPPSFREALDIIAEEGVDGPIDWDAPSPAATWTDIKRHLRKRGVTDSKTISQHLRMLTAQGLIVKTPGDGTRDVYSIAQGYTSARDSYGFLMSFVSSAFSRTELERRESVVRDFLASQHGCGQVNEKFVDEAAWALSVEWAYKFATEVMVPLKLNVAGDGSRDRLGNREEPGDITIGKIMSVYNEDRGRECAPEPLTAIFPPYIDAVALDLIEQNRDLIEQNRELGREDVASRLEREGQDVCDALKGLFAPQHETGAIAQVLRRSPLALEMMLRIHALSFEQLNTLTLRVPPEVFFPLKTVASSPRSARRLLLKTGLLGKGDIRNLFSAKSPEKAAFMTLVGVALQLYADYQRFSPLLLCLSCYRAIDRLNGTGTNVNTDGPDFDLFTELSAIPYDRAKSLSFLDEFELDSDREFLENRERGRSD